MKDLYNYSLTNLPIPRHGSVMFVRLSTNKGNCRLELSDLEMRITA
jgi:hypothetical protein